MDKFGSFTNKVKYPHVHLCFDDHSITNWYTARGTLLFNKAKAVFYVDSWDDLDDEDIDRLKALRSDGHVIGCHSASHKDALIFSKKHGVDAYVEEEVIPAMESMASAGFSPTHFAFPYSSFDDALYEAVSKLFCHVRLGNDRLQYTDDRIIVRTDEQAANNRPSYEHMIRSNAMNAVIRDIKYQMKSNRGINIVFHDVRRIGSPPHKGTQASDTAFVTTEELNTVLATINAEGGSYETFADHCKVGKDPFDKPESLV
jgi:peptidoglycan/xylan/chitin deacetylase (PgdA/CDA1 family)